MAVGVSCVIRPQRRNKKVRLRPDLYDGYAIYCDQDHSKIINLLNVLGSLGLRIQSKHNIVLGENFFEANIDKGILVSRYCLLFVSTNFKCDRFCTYLMNYVLLKYVFTNRKYRIITICLDHTKIPCLEIFTEISIKNFTCGTIPKIILSERLLCIIYKAIKGPRQKLIYNKWTRFHMSNSCKKKRKKRLLKTVKSSKFSRFKFSFALKSCAHAKIINLGYLICKCFFNSFLWRKLTTLITCQRVLSIIPHHSKKIEHHLQLKNADHTGFNIEEQKVKQSVCRYCRAEVFTSKLDEHENECCKPMECESCGILIPRARKKDHENQCIFEECSLCLNFHSSSVECSQSNGLRTGICEDMDSSSQDDISLSTQITPEVTMNSDMKKIVKDLLEIVTQSFSKENKKNPEWKYLELTNFVDKLLKQMKHHKMIDQCIIDTIFKTMHQNLIPIVYSSKSLNYFRNFVYAVDLHCANICLFKEQPLVKQVMCGDLPQPRKRISIFCRKKLSNPEPKPQENFISLTKDLFKI